MQQKEYLGKSQQHTQLAPYRQSTGVCQHPAYITGRWAIKSQGFDLAWRPEFTSCKNKKYTQDKARESSWLEVYTHAVIAIQVALCFYQNIVAVQFDVWKQSFCETGLVEMKLLLF